MPYNDNSPSGFGLQKMSLRVYIAFHPSDYKAARTIGEALSGQHSVYGESIGSDSAATAGIDALQDADLHLYLLSPAAVKTRAFRHRYAISRQHDARTLPILIAPLPASSSLSGSYIDATNQLDALLPQLQRYAAELAYHKRRAAAPWYRRREVLALVGVLLLFLVGGAFALLPRNNTPAPDDGLMVAEASEEATEESLSATSTHKPTRTATDDTSTEATAVASEEVDDDDDLLFVGEPEETDYPDYTEFEETEEPAEPEENYLFADFFVDPLEGEAPLTVYIENYSEGDIVAYAWDFDEDGIIDSTAADPQPFIYMEPGDYLLSLTIRDEAGNEDTFSEYILVFDPGDGGGGEEGGGGEYFNGYLDFIADPQYGEAPLIVNFENVSEGNFTNYAWDFDADGVVDSTSANPGAFTYNQVGDYEIRVSALDPNSEEHVAYGYITVDAPPEPFVFISAEPDYGPAPLTVTFSAEVDGVATQYRWDFDGNGSIDSQAQNPGTHTYTQPGEYNVTLTVTGPGGTAEDTWYIYVEAPEEPYAAIGASVYSGDAPLTVTFTDLSTGSVTSRAWDFNGDGSTDSTAKNPAPYTYNQPGFYDVTLNVSGPGGSSSDVLTIVVEEDEVAEPPIAAFDADPETGTAPLTVSFTDESTGDITSYAWDFNGDGSTDSTAQNPTALYNTPGDYEVSLVVTGPGGESDPYTVWIEVLPIEETPEVTPEITETATPEVTPEITPEVTPEVTPEITETPTPEVTPEITPEITESPTPETTPEVTPEITPEVTPEITESPTPEPAVASFSALPTSGIAPLVVTITNTSSGDIVLTEWDFEGDGIFDTTNPALTSHTYTVSGIYVLTLRVTGEDGNTSTMNIPIDVTSPETTPEVTPEVTEPPGG